VIEKERERGGGVRYSSTLQYSSVSYLDCTDEHCPVNEGTTPREESFHSCKARDIQLEVRSGVHFKFEWGEIRGVIKMDSNRLFQIKIR
jgi:hypothetical protein